MDMVIIFILFLFVLGLIIAIKGVVEDRNAAIEAELEPKGVEDRLASGTVGFVCFNLIA